MKAGPGGTARASAPEAGNFDRADITMGGGGVWWRGGGKEGRGGGHGTGPADAGAAARRYGSGKALTLIERDQAVFAASRSIYALYNRALREDPAAVRAWC